MKKFISPVTGRNGLTKGQRTAASTISRFPNKPNQESILWTNWHGHYSKIIRALNRTSMYRTIFVRFFDHQDNVFITHDNQDQFGQDMGRSAGGYSIHIGNNGYLINGYLVADPTLIAKVVMHEGLHVRYDMARAEGKLLDYSTLYRHHKIAEAKNTLGERIRLGKKFKFYEADHQAMAEGNIDTLVKGMIQFDREYGSTHSKDWYVAIAWWGSLTRATSNWENMPASSKDRYIRIQDNERNYMTYLKAKAIYLTNKNALNKTKYNNAWYQVNWTLFKQTRTK